MKQSNHPKIRIFCDLPVLIGSSAVFVGLSVLYIFAAFSMDFNSDPEQNLKIRIIILAACMGSLAFWFQNLPRWSANALLTSEGIYFRRAFKETVFAPYAFYQCLYRGEYFHDPSLSGVGNVRAYVVFSKERLTPEKLGEINTAPPSADIIKLRGTKRNLRKLQQMLPEPHRGKLELLFR